MGKKDDTTDIEDETKIIFKCYIENSLQQDRNNSIIDLATLRVQIERLPSIDNDLKQERNNNIIDPGIPGVKIKRLPSINNDKDISELSRSLNNDFEKDIKNIIDLGTQEVHIEALPSIDNEKCLSIGKKLFELSKSIKLDDNDTMLRQILSIDDRSKGAFQDSTSVAKRNIESFSKDLAEMLANRKLDDTSSMMPIVTAILRPTGGYSTKSLHIYKSLVERILLDHISLDSILYFFQLGYLIARERLIQGELYIIHEIYHEIEDAFKNSLVFHWIRDKGGWKALLSQSSSNNRYLFIGGAFAIMAILYTLFLRFRRFMI